MTDRKISKPEALRALRRLARVGIKSLRFAAGGYDNAELRELAADVAEIAIDLLAATDADGEG